AWDGDEGRSGLVGYSVPPDAPLSVGPYNGSLYTSTSLDYEAQQVHYVVVTATDGGRPPLSATATVTLMVGDVSDEPPIFPQVGDVPPIFPQRESTYCHNPMGDPSPPWRKMGDPRGGK
ncbi:Cadherin, partial [Trinorchestia longiramus]